MKKALKRTVCLLACCAGAILAQPAKLTKAEVDGMMKELSNWGRWGKDDQTGAYHLITPAVRKAAAGLVKDGVSISLSRRLDGEKALDNATPFASKPIRDGDFAMDEYTVSYHGFAHTHMDSLGHMWVAGKGYNGFPTPAPNKGLDKLAIGNFKEGIFTRGVLIDLPKLKGVKYLEPGTAIYPSDLDAWEKSTGVHIGSGDAVLFRTGRWLRRSEKGPWAAQDKVAGLDARCVRWLKQRDIAVFASEGPGDVLPSGVDGVAWPVHQLLLIATGTAMLDNCDFEELTQAANARGRLTFLLTVAPLRVDNGTGAPVNPVATF
jgi:kynurenine formamidase